MLLTIAPVHCAACRAELLECLAGVPGIRNTDVALGATTIRLEIDASAFDLASTLEAMVAAGWPVSRVRRAASRVDRSQSGPNPSPSALPHV